MSILSDITTQIQRFHTEIIRVLSQSLAGQNLLLSLLDVPFLVVSASSALTAERVLVAGSGISFIDSGSNGNLVISAFGGGDKGAQYLTLANTASLDNERLFTPGTGLLGTDAGANSSYTLAINNNVVATVSGTTFTGPVSASAGLSGSLQRIGPNLTYIAAGTGISVVTASTGQIQISSTNISSGDPGATYLVVSTTASLTAERSLTAGAHILFTDAGANNTFTITGANQADKGAQFLTLANTASLDNERLFTPGTGLLGTDAGANSTYTLAINNNVVATVSGTTFTGPVSASAGLSGSLQNIGPNLTYLAAGSNVTIVTQSNGQVVISSTGGGGGGGSGDAGAQYLTLANTASLSAERLFSASIGLTPNDGGANNTYSLRVDDNVIDTTASIILLTAELDAISDELEALTGSLSGSFNDANATYLTLTTSSLLNNERVFTSGLGLSGIDAGANSTYTLGINNNVVATVSGTTFTGPVSASAGLSGSLQRIGPNLTYLVAGSNITITSASNGQVTIASTGGSSAPTSEFWATPASPSSIDDEFDDGTLASDWSMFLLSSQSFVPSSGPVAYFNVPPSVTQWRHTEHANGNRSWLAIQTTATESIVSSNNNEFCLVRNCSASIASAGNEFVIRARLRGQKTFGDNTILQGTNYLGLFGDNGGKPHLTEPGGTLIQFGWLNASTQQSWFLQQNINGSRTLHAVSAIEDDRKQIDAEFIIVRRNPNQYYAFLKSAGFSTLLKSFSVTSSLPWLGFGFINKSTTAGPTPIVSIDYFRFEPLTSSSFIP